MLISASLPINLPCIPKLDCQSKADDRSCKSTCWLQISWSRFVLLTQAHLHSFFYKSYMPNDSPLDRQGWKAFCCSSLTKEVQATICIPIIALSCRKSLCEQTLLNRSPPQHSCIALPMKVAFKQAPAYLRHNHMVRAMLGWMFPWLTLPLRVTTFKYTASAHAKASLQHSKRCQSTGSTFVYDLPSFPTEATNDENMTKCSRWGSRRDTSSKLCPPMALGLTPLFHPSPVYTEDFSAD